LHRYRTSALGANAPRIDASTTGRIEIVVEKAKGWNETNDIGKGNGIPKVVASP
jgi:hypothetical protein